MSVQGSKEWHDERSCRLTTSRFGDIIANPNTKRYKNYQLEKVNELFGAPHMEDNAPWFNHGKELEPFAIDRYDFEMAVKHNQSEVEKVGFVVHPEYDFIGSSSDGKIGDLKGIEVKSSIVYTAYEKNIKKGIPSNHKPQVQGEIWVNGYESVDFVCFFRDPDGILPDEIHIENILPDLEYHEMLERKCLKFWEEIQKTVKENEYLG